MLRSIIIFLCLMLLVSYSYAQEKVNKDWVESIIETEILERKGEDEIERVKDKFNNLIKNSNQSSNNDSVITGFEFKTKKMRDHITSIIGQPNGNYYILLLLSLAITLEMIRVYYGSSNWSRFLIRIGLVLSFIMVFPSLFNGIEYFFQSITKSILGGQSSLDLFFSNQGLLYENLYFNNTSIWTVNIETGILMAINLISGIIALVVSYALYLIQNCILVVLYYLGPLIIALAIIVETDYTKGYLETLIETCLWPVIAALLIQIISSSMTFNFNHSSDPSDLIIMVIMNLCYALAMFTVPIIANSVVSGHGVGTVGMAGLAVGTKVVSRFMNLTKNSIPRSLNTSLGSNRQIKSSPTINARFVGYGHSSQRTNKVPMSNRLPPNSIKALPPHRRINE